MPVPLPKKGEDKKAFVSRCVEHMRKKDPQADPKQIIAMCYSKTESALIDEEICELDKLFSTLFLDQTLKSFGVSSRAELPDAAFAVIDSSKSTGKVDGKTKPDSVRYLPHHTKAVTNPNDNRTVDKALLRNALARMNQISTGPDLKAQAKAHLVKHAKALLPTSQFTYSDITTPPSERLPASGGDSGAMPAIQDPYKPCKKGQCNLHRNNLGCGPNCPVDAPVNDPGGSNMDMGGDMGNTGGM